MEGRRQGRWPWGSGGEGRSDPLGIFSFSPHRDIHIVLFYKVAFLLLFIVDALTGLPTLKMKQQLG